MLKKLALNKWHKLNFSLLVLLLFSDNTSASVSYQNTQLHGFIMQSYIKTDKNNFFGNSAGKGSLDYTEIGINGSVKLSSNFQIASQLLSRRAGKTDDGEIKLDFALADYRFIDRFDYGIGIRAGRVKNPIGFYNETRDVSFTRESIVLPQSIYFERTREVSISADGAHLYGHKQTSIGVLNGQMGIVLPRVTGVNTEYALLGGIKPGSFVAKPSFGGQIKIESNDSRTTIALSHVNLFMDYEPGASEPGFTENGDVHFLMNIFSIKTNLLNWSFTSEYAQRSINFSGFPTTPNPVGAFIPDVLSGVTGESYYFQAIYRFSHKWNLIARYDVLFSDKRDRDGESYAQALSMLGAKSYSRFAKDLMMGIQFSIDGSWMLRLELHDVDGTAWIPVQDNLDSTAIDRNWRMMNVSMSYRF